MSCPATTVYSLRQLRELRGRKLMNSHSPPPDDDVCRIAATIPYRVLTALFDQSRDCIKVIGADGRLDYMTPNGRAAMEVDDLAMIAGRYWWDLWPAESRDLIKDAVEQSAAGRSTTFEAFCPTAKGTPRWWEVNVSPILDDDGRFEAIVSISRDITDRVRDRQHLQEIALEMRHRVRNAYGVCVALTNVSSRAEAGHEEFADALAARLGNVAKAQSALLDIGTGQESASQIISAICTMFDPGGQQIRLTSLADVPLATRTAQTIALIFGELCTNSLKYGALLHQGTVAVSAQDSGGVLQVTWREAFRPTQKVDGLSSTRTGLEMIRRLLRIKAGELDLDLTEGGLDIRFRLPLSDEAARSHR